MVNPRSLYLLPLLMTLTQTRDLWSEDLPQGPEVTLHQGQPIQLATNYTAVQLCKLNGTLYSDSLSKLSGVKELRICKHQLKKIEAGALCAPPSLATLDVDFYGNADPPALSGRAFEGCGKLEELLLKFDFISPPSKSLLDAHTFRPLTGLKKLAVQGYRVSHLGKAFLGIPGDQLKELVLSFAYIKRIDGDALEGLEGLEVLYIVHNNELDHLPKELFGRLSKLKKLILRDNAIADLTWDEFKGLSSLEELDLVDNEIAYVDVGKIVKHLPKLASLQLDINPIACKQKAVFADELVAKFGRPVEVSHDFHSGFDDSCD